MNIIKPKAVLFDLDGTLLDTAGDLGKALNLVLAKRNLPPLPLSTIRPEAGRGCKGLLKLGLDMDDSHADYTALCDELLDNYHRCLSDSTQLFPGMEDVLLHLEAANIPWGIVTNKPKRFTNDLIDVLKLTARSFCVISGDSLNNRKPHPEPILHACNLLKHQPEDCLYIGDSEVDVIASKAAGTRSLVAMYGYIPSREKPESWGADGYIQQPVDIFNWI